MAHDILGRPGAQDINTLIEEGVTHPDVWVVPFSGGEPEFRRVEVVSRYDARQAYVINDAVEPRELSHGGDLPWGVARVGYMLPRNYSDLLYYEPPPPGVQGHPNAPPMVQVMIKILSRAVVEHELGLGSAENPIQEICQVEQLFREAPDEAGQHVVQVIEALQNENFIYVITRYCEGGSLHEHIWPDQQHEPFIFTEHRAREIFTQMLERINYIHSHNICHRDISPDNFLVTGEGRVLLCDFAQSFQIPQGGVVQPLGKYRGGKPRCWSPEIMRQVDFNAFQLDLWACVVSLFNLLTGMRPYHVPFLSDIAFRFCIIAGGLDGNLANERVQDVLRDTEYTVRNYHPDAGPDERSLIIHREQLELDCLIQRLIILSPQVRELFYNCLRFQPQDRWTIQQIWESEWMNMELPESS